jgi:hypothetical protein
MNWEKLLGIEGKNRKSVKKCKKIHFFLQVENFSHLALNLDIRNNMG